MEGAIAEDKEDEFWLVSRKIYFTRSKCLSFKRRKIRKK